MAVFRVWDATDLTSAMLILRGWTSPEWGGLPKQFDRERPGRKAALIGRRLKKENMKTGLGRADESHVRPVLE